MKVKICGLTSLEDALGAVEAGADLLGFNFYPPSPRCIRPEACARIVEALKRRGTQATLVGVFVNAGVDEVEATLARCGLDLAQLHGDEPPEALAALGGRAFKALRPADAAGLEQALRDYPPRSGPPAYLVDASVPEKYGGTGRQADWGLARELADRTPVLLAGGLTPADVAAAARQVRPWGVDVASGVEAGPGKKDPDKMKAFVAEVRKIEISVER